MKGKSTITIVAKGLLIFAVLIIAEFAYATDSIHVKPTYSLKVSGQNMPSPNEFVFEVRMRHTNPDSTVFNYAGAMYFFNFNNTIANGGTLSYGYVSGTGDSSDLPVNFRPRNPQIFDNGNGTSQLRLAVNTFPGPGNGYVMPSDLSWLKICKMKLTTTATTFSGNIGLQFRDSLPNPYTKVFAYTLKGNLVNTEISNRAWHYIEPFPPISVTADFGSNVYTINPGDSVNFIDLSIGPPTNWLWSFPGGTPSTSNQQNPRVKYSVPGYYPVTLIASNAISVDTITRGNFIRVLPLLCTPSWKQALRISDSGNGNDSLSFGMSFSGTDGIDTCLGEVPVPPPPPLGIFDCRFVLPTNEGTKIDIRRDSATNMSWRMTFQPSSGYPIIFNWNPITLPSSGLFYLKDVITGTIINVDMRTQSSYTLTLSGISSLKIEYIYNSALSSTANSGWNILSVPLRTADMLYTTLFPGVASQAYTYSNGYVGVSTLSNGSGYWMKFNNAETFNFTGFPWSPQNMNVSSGWNLIAPFDANIPVSSIVSNPSGIVNSYYFGYGGSYAIADTLKVGKGYWIRTSASGYLYKGAMDNIPNQPAANPLEQFAELRLASGEDEHASLFLGMANELTSDYTLPPVPPSGIFDVRFGTDKFVEELGRNHVLKINSASRETKLTIHNTKGAKFRVKDGIDGSIINQELVEGAEIIIPASLGTLLLETSAILPLTYELSQNYPNPFNPVTTIKYQLPKDGLVKIAVYDVLGKEVKTLVNSNQTAGAYEVRLDASSLASGVYFYRMTSGSFHNLKKMIVLK